LKVWRAAFGTPPRSAFCVSAFAANDPESSAAALGKVREILPRGAGPFLGLVCLREDRGDRTLQWVRAASAGFFDGFERVAFLGLPAAAARRRLRKSLGPGLTKYSFDADPNPGEWTSRLVSFAADAPGEPVVVGLGNIVGIGEGFIRCWSESGSLHGR
jgi:hypothetical protein